MKRVVLAALFSLISGAAQAAVVNFDFTGATATLSGVAASSDGYVMTASPTTNNIRINSNGIGVTSAPEGGRLGANETIVFAGPVFDELSVDIWETGNQDEDFRVTINGTSYDLTIPGGANGASIVTFDLTPFIPTGGIQTFSITGLEPNAPGNRGVRVAGVTVNVVPLPAAGGMMLAGMAAFGMAKRRRRQATAA